MSYELKNGSGSIFKNNKEKDSQPDYKGNIKTPEGKEYEIALWLKEGQKVKYFSVKIQEPYKAEDQQSDSSQSEDDLPF